MRAVLWLLGALIAAVLGLFAYVVITDEGPPIIRRTVHAVRDYALGRTSDESSPAAEEPAADTRKPAAGGPAAGAADSSPAPRGRSATPAQPTAPAAVTTRGAPPVPPPPVAPRRTDLYVPGSRSDWTTIEAGGVPLRLRAGGVISTPEESSGPEGIRGSVYERNLARRGGGSLRVVPSAPYLALIGRVCTGEVCSEPFVVGSTRLLCQGDLAPGARLQLWTNNYIQVEGTRTVSRFSSASGGYAVYAEPTSPDACAGGVSAARAPDAAAIAAGQVVSRPEFVITSSQTSWKPFFLPLELPLRLVASGEMQPSGGARVTGPGGIAVPDAPRWVYPGTSDLIVDGENRLYDARFPYQALIGRVCGAAGCSQPFLVGTDRVVCAGEGHRDRLELWINHIVRPESLLGSQLSLSIQALELQGRRGEYTFRVSRAPDSACP